MNLDVFLPLHPLLSPFLPFPFVAPLRLSLVALRVLPLDSPPPRNQIQKANPQAKLVEIFEISPWLRKLRDHSTEVG